MESLEEAIDRVMAGPKRKSVLLSEKERKVIAYHEGGHALVGHAMPHADPVHKVTIIPRGRALGVTMSLPAQDRYSYDREYMLNQISMLALTLMVGIVIGKEIAQQRNLRETGPAI